MTHTYVRRASGHTWAARSPSQPPQPPTRATVESDHSFSSVAVRLLAAALILASVGAATPALAQDRWNPFEDIAGSPVHTPSPRRKPAVAPPPADAPYLPPMQGAPGPGTRSPADPYVDPENDRPLGAAVDAADPRAQGSVPAPSSVQGAGPAQPPAFGPVGPREKLESAELAPLQGPPPPVAAAGSGAGFDTKAMAGLLGGLAIPSRSPALATMLRRLFAAPDSVLAGGGAEHLAMRIEVLYRSGHVAEAAALTAAADAAVLQAPVMQALTARTALAAGDAQRACAAVKAAAAARSELPQGIAGEVLVMQGWCAAVEGNPAAAGLAANLAREQGAAAPELLAALDAVAIGETPRLEGLKQLQVIHWRLAETGNSAPAGIRIEAAEPAALAAIAQSGKAKPIDRLHAAEAAARINAIAPDALAAAYRLQQIPDEGSPARNDGAMRRALMLRAAETERTPFKTTRHIRAALDDARRHGLYLQMAAALAPAVAQIRPVPEIGWFTETGIEVMLAAGRYDDARRWAAFGAGDAGRVGANGNPLGHWLALIDIADPRQGTRRGDSLSSVEDMALRGRFTPDALHRLATVLDALDYQVPFRLWEASSRAPQPTSGFLPPTGVLNDLNLAAKARDVPRTILLTIRALGPHGSDGAQIIALGDAIRALKRVGLLEDARRIGFEALFALWPRAANS